MAERQIGELMFSNIRSLYYLNVICIMLVGSASAQTKDAVQLVAGLPKPPFIIEKQGRGLQLDIIRSALEMSDHDTHFIHMPAGRSITGFYSTNADGVITLLPDYDHPALNMSKPYITYQNVVVSLSENKFNIETIKDLSDKSIIAFQNARKFLGDEFVDMVSYSIDYREIHDQKQQIEMLFLRRVQAIIIDINIFKYFIKHQSKNFSIKPVSFHYIFNERRYSAGFKSKEIRDKFDQNIQIMRANGSYQLIVDNYLNE